MQIKIFTQCSALFRTTNELERHIFNEHTTQQTIVTQPVHIVAKCIESKRPYGKRGPASWLIVNLNAMCVKSSPYHVLS